MGNETSGARAQMTRSASRFSIGKVFFLRYFPRYRLNRIDGNFPQTAFTDSLTRIYDASFISAWNENDSVSRAPAGTLFLSRSAFRSQLTLRGPVRAHSLLHAEQLAEELNFCRAEWQRFNENTRPNARSQPSNPGAEKNLRRRNNPRLVTCQTHTPATRCTWNNRAKLADALLAKIERRRCLPRDRGLRLNLRSR